MIVINLSLKGLCCQLIEIFIDILKYVLIRGYWNLKLYHLIKRIPTFFGATLKTNRARLWNSFDKIKKLNMDNVLIKGRGKKYCWWLLGCLNRTFFIVIYIDCHMLTCLYYYSLCLSSFTNMLNINTPLNLQPPWLKYTLGLQLFLTFKGI